MINRKDRSLSREGGERKSWVASTGDRVGQFANLRHRGFWLQSRVVGAIASSLALLVLLLVVLPLVVVGAGTLKIDKSAPPVVEAGAVMTYTIAVTNNTTQTITQTWVHDSVPLYTTYVSASMTSLPGVLTATQPLAVAARSPMTWTIASLAAGDSISMTFQVTVSHPLISGTKIYNTATISGDSDKVTTTVHGRADVTVTKTVDPAQARPGGIVTYTLRLTKTGKGVAQDMTVTDDLPPGFRPADKAWPPQSITDFLTLTLTATVPMTEGTYYNTVTVAYDGKTVSTGPTAPVIVRRERVYLPLVIRNYPPLSWHQGERTAGLTVYRVEACPDDHQRLYAATKSNGVWSSQDGGQKWDVDGLQGRLINWLEVQPDDCETVYAAAWGAGVQEKTQGGWHAANAGLDDLYIDTLAMAPNGQTLYAGTARHGVYKKGLGGSSSWSPANGGLPPNARVVALAIDPTNADVIYAGLWGGGVYRSEDGGATWTARNGGLGDLQIFALALDPTEPKVVYAATSQQGVYRTADGGDHWLLDGLPGQTVYTLGVDQGGVVYAGTDGMAGVAGGKGLYKRSAASGWEPMDPQPYDNPVVVSVSLCDHVLWLGTTDGVWWYGPD